MSILSCEQVSHTFSGTWLFKDLTFGISKGQRIALVGINGSGKSTLLRILAGKILPTEGKVVKEKGLRIGYLEQDPDFSNQNTVGDFIYSLDNKQQQLIREYETLLASPSDTGSRLEKLTEELSAINAWEYEYQIKTILQRLSINNPAQTIKSLSGGQKKRLALAKLLIDEPDLFILDEPTNHLDIEMIEWLESFLTSGSKTLLMVTHDRYFLDNICNNIVELDRQRLFNYTGKYSYFLEKKAEREAEDQISFQRNKNLLARELEWMRRQPQARATKSKARIDAFYELEKKTKSTGGSQKIELSTRVSRQGNKILELHRITKSFEQQEIIKDFSYTFKKGDKIGIAGKNGSGKSTFLNLITGELTPDAGTVVKGETTLFGYYKQSGLDSDPQERVIDVVKNVAEYITMADGKILSASQLLSLFLFPPEKQFNVVGKLSGGEKKRLQLMRVLIRNPNFLILDEPTNDLDIDTLNVLEDFLINYTGVLLLVSHDRYLIDRLTNQLFIFEEKGHLRIYSGNYTDYRLEKETTTRAQKTEKPISNITSTPKTKLSYKEKLELETIDKEIEETEKNIKNLTDLLNSGISDYVELQKLSEEIERKKVYLDEITLRWMELTEIKEKQ